jgi:hypothetical protein
MASEITCGLRAAVMFAAEKVLMKFKEARKG